MMIEMTYFSIDFRMFKNVVPPHPSPPPLGERDGVRGMKMGGRIDEKD